MTSFDLNNLKRKLSPFSGEKIVFVSLGNEFRGDDRGGIYFLRKLREKGVFSRSVFIEAGTAPENYLSPIIDLDPEAIIFIDAVQCEDKPGEIVLIEPGEISSAGFSTHSYSVKLLERFLKMFISSEIFYIGINQASCKKISRAVNKNINRVLMNS